MSIRGIGDQHATRRLQWLFGTTVVAPSVLLGLLAMGAFGHQRWTAGELAVREVEVQLPALSALLDHHVDDLRAMVPEGCAPPDCALPAGLMFRDGAPAADVEALGAWIAPYVAGHRDQPVGVRIAPAGDLLSGAGSAGDGGPPLHGLLHGATLSVHVPDGWKGAAQYPLMVVSVVLLGLIVIVGSLLGLGAAAREIRMSQRQTDLIGRVSHELRTPLTSIRMFVDTLRDGRLGPARAAECLDVLAQESERLSRRIDELLLWARMESGARVYHPSPVPPREIATEAVAAFRSHLLLDDEQATALQVDVPEDLPPLLVDRDAVVEAVLNLLTNAWRHTPSPRRIQLAARVDGRRVGLAVSDAGPGIPFRERRRIFEKFYRPADREDGASPTHGSGLGLAIVRAIARAQNGRVELDSELGRGSTFTLWLPVA